MISGIHYCPDGSHDKGFVAVAAAHGVGSGGFFLVAFARVGAAAAFVSVSDIVSMRPAVIAIVVVTSFAAGAAGVGVGSVVVVVSCRELCTEGL